MLSITSMTLEHASHYLRADDYRQGSEHHTLTPSFQGSLVSSLGLDSVPFSDGVYQDALVGEYPVGEGVRPVIRKPKNGKARSPRVGFDFTLSPPKSVSFAALVLGDDRIAEAHHRAVERAMRYAEQYARCRVTVDGRRDAAVRQKTVQGSGLAWVPYVHTMSRLRKGSQGTYGGDPQLHTHVAVLNATRDPDGNLRALDVGQMMRNLKTIGAEYQVQLARELRELGYAIEVKSHKRGGGETFEIKGISQDVLTKFSDGRQAIERHLADEQTEWVEKYGWAKATSMANKTTREAKTRYDIRPEERVAWWEHKAKIRGLDLEQVRRELQSNMLSERTLRRDRAAPPPTAAEVDEWTRDSVKALSERKAKFSEGEIVQYAARISRLRATPDLVRDSMSRLLASGELILRRDGTTYTTRELVECEVKILQSYLGSRGSVAAVTADYAAVAGIKRFETMAGFELSRGQRDAVNTILTSRDSVTVVVGDAGTGKSTSMAAVKLLAPESGFKVVGLAPSAKAKSALEESLGSGSVITSQRATRDRRWWSKVDASTIIILDEAGLVDARAMHKIMTMARQKGARLALVGDPKQYASVEAGSALLQLVEAAQKDGALVRLDQMQRAKTDVLKQLHLLSRDDPKASLKAMFENKLVRTYKDEGRRHRYIADSYAALSQAEREVSLVITGKNVDRVAIQAAIRERLNLGKGLQITSFEARDVTKAELKYAHTYGIGDLVQAVTKTSSGLDKGAVGTVVSRDEIRRTVTVELESGKRVDIDLKADHEKIKLGDREKLEIAPNELIRFTAGMKVPVGQGVLEIANGTRARVTAVDLAARTITISRLDAPKPEAITIRMQDAMPIRHGYVITGHSGQGHTMDKRGRLWVHATSDDGTVNRNSWYTNLTRSTTHVELVTDAKTGKSLEKLGAKVSRELTFDRALDDAQALREEAERRRQAEAEQKAQQEVAAGQVKAVLTPRDGLWSEDGEKLIPADQRPVAEQLADAKKTLGDRIHAAGSDAYVSGVADAAVGYDVPVDLVDPRGREAQAAARDRDFVAHVSETLPLSPNPVQLPGHSRLVVPGPDAHVDHVRIDGTPVIREYQSRVRLLERGTEALRSMVDVCVQKWEQAVAAGGARAGLTLRGKPEMIREFTRALIVRAREQAMDLTVLNLLRRSPDEGLRQVVEDELRAAQERRVQQQAERERIEAEQQAAAEARREAERSQRELEALRADTSGTLKPRPNWVQEDDGQVLK
jgi:conjugative relaxase-like TrwC/TraI family protein